MIKISIQEFNNLKKSKDIILVDVRSRQEFNEGHISESINIPLIDLDRYSFNKNKTIVLYCNAGIRSKKAMTILKNKGYRNLFILDPIEIP